MMSSLIPSRPSWNFYTEFQLELWEIQLYEMKKELDKKKIMEIQRIVMDVAIKDDGAKGKNDNA